MIVEELMEILAKRNPKAKVMVELYDFSELHSVLEEKMDGEDCVFLYGSHEEDEEE